MFGSAAGSRWVVARARLLSSSPSPSPSPLLCSRALAARHMPSSAAPAAGSSLHHPAAAAVAAFHSSAPRRVEVGDGLPDVELMEDSPGNKVNLHTELAKGKGLVIGVPAAFSPSCSGSHIPGYISSPKLGSAGKVFVVSVNDPFVMKAWATSLDPSGASNIRFLADPGNEFTSALELDFDGSKIFGNRRSVRYALVMEDGKVKSKHVEPEKTPVDVSAASKVLG